MAAGNHPGSSPPATRLTAVDPRRGRGAARTGRPAPPAQLSRGRDRAPAGAHRVRLGRPGRGRARGVVGCRALTAISEHAPDADTLAEVLGMDPALTMPCGTGADQAGAAADRGPARGRRGRLPRGRRCRGRRRACGGRGRRRGRAGRRSPPFLGLRAKCLEAPVRARGLGRWTCSWVRWSTVRAARRRLTGPTCGHAAEGHRRRAGRGHDDRARRAGVRPRAPGRTDRARAAGGDAAGGARAGWRCDPRPHGARRGVALPRPALRHLRLHRVAGHRAAHQASDHPPPTTPSSPCRSRSPVRLPTPSTGRRTSSRSGPATRSTPAGGCTRGWSGAPSNAASTRAGTCIPRSWSPGTSRRTPSSGRPCRGRRPAPGLQHRPRRHVLDEPATARALAAVLVRGSTAAPSTTTRSLPPASWIARPWTCWPSGDSPGLLGSPRPKVIPRESHRPERSSREAGPHDSLSRCAMWCSAPVRSGASSVAVCSAPAARSPSSPVARTSRRCWLADCASTHRQVPRSFPYRRWVTFARSNGRPTMSCSSR